MARAAARAMALLTTPPTTLQRGPTFVPADEQPRLGEHVVHGDDALTEWHGHRSGMQCSACFEGIKQ